VKNPRFGPRLESTYCRQQNTFSGKLSLHLINLIYKINSPLTVSKSRKYFFHNLVVILVVLAAGNCILEPIK